MIFLSAQPDEFYFKWQLQLQLHNFRQVGINPKNIHVLIGFNPQRGLSQESKQLIHENSTVSFFTYPDNRQNRYYPSSIRPHIIAQHFDEFPHLQQEIIFYHDSDMIFKCLPDFQGMSDDEIWYASDARFYLGTKYILSTAGQALFHEMCGVVGIDPDVVAANDHNAGGAQYLLKNCTAYLWRKIEAESETMFRLLTDFNAKRGLSISEAELSGIQAWCADMWVLWWNALCNKKRFQVHSELDFCWADSPIKDWETKKILHYTGSIHKENTVIFRKGNYMFFAPFHDDFSLISKETCSWFVIETIKSYVTSRKKNRVSMEDVTFLISVSIDSFERLQNINAVIRYLTAWLTTNIILLETGTEQKIDPCAFPPEVKFIFKKSSSPKFHRTKYNNYLLSLSNTPIVGIYDADVIFPIEQLVLAVAALRSNEYAVASPYSGSCANVDSLLKEIFIRILDPQVLADNKNKLRISARRACGGAVFLNASHFRKAGGDNEKITSWGPDDLERVKRMEILGYPMKRINGELYHLPHPRGINSAYQSTAEHDDLMSILLEVSSMRQEELKEYIKNMNPYNDAYNEKGNQPEFN